ncbi:uncharacterized protein LOC101857328 [Aplysia californica]|uniref:Uncharacterized protein LOC101857328 n=1 Tax=Aplysia californica TaxID=6500 RepID=A0ABM0JMJ9_APLCA|nr:uncharacterized protein LOC101857328 [Aplysia californica]
MAGTLSPRPKSSGMTSWSRYDPVHKSGNTDHWTKLKCRSNTFRATQSAGMFKVIPEHEFDQTTSLNNPSERFQVTDGTSVSQLPSGTFNDNVLHHLGGKPPGDHDVLTRPTSNLQRRWMHNIYQKRAKDGFRYWLINRPHPTNFGKYGMGSYKMVMGIGMAPRT